MENLFVDPHFFAQCYLHNFFFFCWQNFKSLEEYVRKEGKNIRDVSHSCCARCKIVTHVFLMLHAFAYALAYRERTIEEIKVITLRKHVHTSLVRERSFCPFERSSGTEWEKKKSQENRSLRSISDNSFRLPVFQPLTRTCSRTSS